MKTTLALLCAIPMIAAAPAVAQTSQDRAATNKAAVRQMFPIVSLFDKRSQAGVTARPVVDSVGSATPAPSGRSATFDVAGVRLGMTPAQAAAALRTAGYALKKDPYPQQVKSYQSQVDYYRSELTHQYGGKPDVMTVGTETFVSGDQSLTVSYVPTRTGSVVADVSWSIPIGRSDWETLKAKAFGKYGRPTRFSDNVYGQNAVWCDDDACSAFATAPVGKLTVSHSLTNVWQTELSDGNATTRAADAQARADARGGVSKEAVSF